MVRVGHLMFESELYMWTRTSEGGGGRLFARAERTKREVEGKEGAMKRVAQSIFILDQLGRDLMREDYVRPGGSLKIQNTHQPFVCHSTPHLNWLTPKVLANDHQAKLLHVLSPCARSSRYHEYRAGYNGRCKTSAIDRQVARWYRNRRRCCSRRCAA